MLGDLPDADILIVDKGYDSDHFRQALADQHIEPCIPDRSNRKRPVACDATLYKRRNLIEHMFAGSRTGAASQHDTIDAPTPPSAPYASPLPAFF